MPNRQTPERTADLERRAWDLRVKSWTHAQIADELSLTPQTISRMLHRVAERLNKAFEAQILDLRTVQTEQLMQITRTALEAWERAKNSALSDTSHQSEPSDSSDTQRHNTQRPNTPTPEYPNTPVPEYRRSPSRYLKLALKAMADLRSIWGIEAARKMEVITAPIAVKRLIGISLEELRGQYDSTDPDSYAHRLPV